MSDTLIVNEVYLSLQGESTFAGLPCVFVRLTACNLRCSYCDTAYAFTEGRSMSIDEVQAEIRRCAGRYDKEADAQDCPQRAADKPASTLPLVELTGGEPLLQKNSLRLMSSLCDEGYTVLVETSGALDISPVDPRVRRIMDLKCPSSGESHRNHWPNVRVLRATDEVKFVVGTREDYVWMKEQLALHRIHRRCPVLVSWVHPLDPKQQNPALKTVPAGHSPVSRRELAELILADALPVRFQAQLHKIIWPPEQRGV